MVGDAFKMGEDSFVYDLVEVIFFLNKETITLLYILNSDMRVFNPSSVSAHGSYSKRNITILINF